MSHPTPTHTIIALLAASLCVVGQAQDPAAAQSAAGEWQALFNGSSLEGWGETPFAGRGKVRVQEGTILLEKGAMTGITWEGAFPRSNFEVRLEAARVDGHDFFAGITFPVKDSHCSWINGGWGGRLVGLSSLDGADASENETRTLRDFENGRWYAFRLRVTDDAIQAWIDDDPVIDIDIEGRQIGLRPGQIKLSVPFGIAAYSTGAALRKIELRVLGKEQQAASVTGAGLPWPGPAPRRPGHPHWLRRARPSTGPQEGDVVRLASWGYEFNFLSCLTHD